MKTTSFFTTLTAIAFILFISFSSIANPMISKSGDEVKPIVNKPISSVETSIANMAASVESEFSYLRFDVDKFTAENACTDELPIGSLNYLCFDVAKFTASDGQEIMKLPVSNEYSALRFDANNFSDSRNDTDTEMPENDFNYLRFNVDYHSCANSPVIEELPFE